MLRDTRFIRFLHKRRFWVVVFLIAFPLPVRGEVRSHLEAYKITQDSKGVEQYEPGNAAIPGDVIEYRVVYKNEGVSGIRNLMGKLPIPEGMTYLADTNAPAPSYASLDGLHFAKVPLTRIVKQPDGTEPVEAVPYSEYRALKWELGDMAAGEAKQVRARVRLNADGPQEAQKEADATKDNTGVFVKNVTLSPR